ncbi:MAG: hypothetical protein PHZ09_05275 [Eubacteriales bacterium]|jgi:hypothetical protein|nr:hypothetical protein [Eubacteriales bacterium]
MKHNLLIVCTLFVMLTATACASNEKAPVSGDTGSDTVFSETTDVPDLTWDGASVTFILRTTPNDWSADDVLAEVQDGTPINDAVYLRNLYIEENYNLKIEGFNAPVDQSVYKPVTNSILANDKAFDVITSYAYDCAKFALEGHILEFGQLKYTDLTKSWWNPLLNETLAIGQKQYYATGDISRVDNLGIRCFFFNKDLAANLSLDSPYDHVKNNTWTIDTMFSMSKQGLTDLDGDGKYGEDDCYGIQAQTSLGIVMAYGCGVNVTRNDPAGVPYLAVTDEAAITKMFRVQEIINTDSLVYYSNDWTNTQNRFTKNQALFQAEVLLLIEALRASEVDIGIIPAPKYDQTQEHYQHLLDAWCLNLYSVPVTAENTDLTGFVLEAMAARSADTLTPAFYDICLQGKYVRDEESSAMLDIIFSSYVMENAIAFSWGGMYDAIYNAIKANLDIVSTIEKHVVSTDTALLKTYEAFREIN